MPSVTGTDDKEDRAREEAFDWLMRLQSAPGDGALRAEFDAWLAADDVRRAAYRSIERVWRLSGELPADHASYARHVRLAAPPDERSAAPFRAKRRSSGSAGWRRLAAATGGRSRAMIGLVATAMTTCLLLIALPTLRLHLEADQITGTAEIRRVVLEDGSVVHLDAHSAIAVNYGPSKREVALLSGQAFFEVVGSEGLPFGVVTGDVTVTVTGTAFSVRSTPQAVSVAVQSGSVAMALDHGRTLVATLAAGDRVIVDRTRRHAEKTKISPDNIAAWRERRLVVDGVPLAEVVDELDRHYRGAIVLRDRTLADRRITGVFDLRHPVEALRAIVHTQQGGITELTPYLLVVTGR